MAESNGCKVIIPVRENSSAVFVCWKDEDFKIEPNGLESMVSRESETVGGKKSCEVCLGDMREYGS